MNELLKELEILTQGAMDDATKAKLLEQATERAGNYVAGAFGVREHEVAILLMSPRRNILMFEFPKVLRKSGTIPLSGRVTQKDAIAVRTMTSKRGEIVNAAPAVKHLAIFEMVKVGGEAPQPIQKMISAALVTPAGVSIGVMQVSRKGETPARAGSDFTEGDLKKLSEIAGALAPFVAKMIPSTY